jgi:hypothetical protein
MSQSSSAASRPDPDSGENMACLFQWTDLERLKAAAGAILGLADDDAIAAALESELSSFQDHLKRALLYLRLNR